jgi:uncharacterized protein (DUF2147 family)
MRAIAIAAAATVALAAPAAADAASYLNTSDTNGARVITAGRTIDRFEIYCSGGGNTETAFGNTFAFSLRDLVALGRKGRFSYSGYAFKYGHEHEPQGEVRVKVSGRLTATAVHAKWTLPDCGSGTFSAARER